MADLLAVQALPLIHELGYDLADLEFVKEGANWYLRFFIEHADAGAPVTTDDCQKVSERLSGWLDDTDPIPQAYFLEVSSPGIERPLKNDKDFVSFQGRMVQVGTFAPIDGHKYLIGILGPATDKELTIKQEGRDYPIPRDMISGVRLYWDEEDEKDK